MECRLFGLGGSDGQVGKCRRTGLINDDYLPLFLASLDVRPLQGLGVLGVDLDLDRGPCSCVLAAEEEEAKKVKKVASNLAGLGVELAELADVLAEQAGLPMAGLGWAGWLLLG